MPFLAAKFLTFSSVSGGKNRFQRFIFGPFWVCIHTFYSIFYFLGRFLGENVCMSYFFDVL